jgi:lysophospholipase L1-like esterase
MPLRQLRAIFGRLRPNRWYGHLHLDIRRQMIAFQLDQIDNGEILVCGDSRVEAALLPSEIAGKKVINGGIGGATISMIDAELPRVLAARHLALLVLSVGVNDANQAKRSPNTVTVFARRLNVTIARLKRYTDRILLTSIPPVEPGKPLGTNYFDNDLIRKLNEILQAAATAHNLSFVDLATPIQSTDGSLRAGLSKDGVHLNRSGYDLWRSILISGIERAVR